MTLDDALVVLRSPDSGEPLVARRRARSPWLPATRSSHSSVDRRSSCLARATRYLELVAAGDRTPPAGLPFEQYIFMHLVRQESGIQNSPVSDRISYLRHVYRCRTMLAGWESDVLHIGCDDPTVSRRVLPGRGPPPRPRTQPQRVGRVPVSSGWRSSSPSRRARASTAPRSSAASITSSTTTPRSARPSCVLRPGGRLLVSSLARRSTAPLAPHRRVPLPPLPARSATTALDTFEIENVVELPWKDDDHRVEIFVSARSRYKRAHRGPTTRTSRSRVFAQLCERASNQYVFLRLDDVPSTPGAVWRHDVDVSVQHALHVRGDRSRPRDRRERTSCSRTRSVTTSGPRRTPAAPCMRRAGSRRRAALRPHVLRRDTDESLDERAREGAAVAPVPRRRRSEVDQLPQVRRRARDDADGRPGRGDDLARTGTTACSPSTTTSPTPTASGASRISSRPSTRAATSGCRRSRTRCGGRSSPWRRVSLPAGVHRRGGRGHGQLVRRDDAPVRSPEHLVTWPWAPL